MSPEDLFRTADSLETQSKAAWAQFHATQPANTIRTVTTDEGVVAFVKSKEGAVTRHPVHSELDLRTKK